MQRSSIDSSSEPFSGPNRYIACSGCSNSGSGCGLRHSFDCDRHALLGQCIEHHIAYTTGMRRHACVVSVGCVPESIPHPTRGAMPASGQPCAGRVLRRVGADFEARYGYRPWLVEALALTASPYCGTVVSWAK